MPILPLQESADIRHNIAQFCQAQRRTGEYFRTGESPANASEHQRRWVARSRCQQNAVKSPGGVAQANPQRRAGGLWSRRREVGIGERHACVPQQSCHPERSEGPLRKQERSLGLRPRDDSGRYRWQPAIMPFNDFREFLTGLRAHGELLDVDRHQRLRGGGRPARRTGRAHPGQDHRPRRAGARRVRHRVRGPTSPRR